MLFLNQDKKTIFEKIKAQKLQSCILFSFCSKKQTIKIGLIDIDNLKILKNYI